MARDETVRHRSRSFPVSRTIVMIVSGIILGLATLALATRLGVSVIERRHPPSGRMVAVNGARLHVIEIGPQVAGELPVVVLHGASANLESMRQPLGNLLARNHRVILIDRPGHGWSTRDRLTDSTPAVQARMIDDTLGEIGVERAVVVGHSWAGALASALALHNPRRVAALALLAPVTHRWPGGIAWYHHVATTPVVGPLFAWTLQMPLALLLMKSAARGAFEPQTMPDNYIRDTAVSLLLRPREFLANSWDMMTLKEAVTAQMVRYGEISVPTIVMTGKADTAVSTDLHARRFAKEARNAQLIELPGAGHLLQNAAPERVVQAIEGLLVQTGAVPAAAE